MITATITFHASYNYGSMLQAYALQMFLMDNGIKNEIINFRTNRQKDLYSLYTKRKGIKYLLKNMSHLFYKTSLKKKNEAFEVFIKTKLVLSNKEYNTLCDLEKSEMKYDVYISGGDQIWNPIPLDFDWSYYLPFVKNGKKISYGVSFGQLSSCGDKEIQSKISYYLKQYNCIGVREEGSAQNVRRLISRNPTITLDPVFLINKEKYIILEKKVSNLPNKGYILFYTLFSDRDKKRIISYISRITKLPIVTTNFSNQYDVFNDYYKHYEAGPGEFLYILHRASLVVTSSFHGTALSIVYNKNFWTIGGNEDARISHILDVSGLKNRSINIENYKNKDYKSKKNINYNNVFKKIEKEKIKSSMFLLNSIKGGTNENQ